MKVATSLEGFIHLFSEGGGEQAVSTLNPPIIRKASFHKSVAYTLPKCPSASAAGLRW